MNREIIIPIGTPGPEIRNIYELIDSMRERPAMYLGHKSIRLMRAYLDGFRHCARELNCLEPESPPFDEFTRWLAAGFKRTGGGASYVNIFYSEALFCDTDADATALDLFYDFLTVYRSRESTVRAQAAFSDKRESEFIGYLLDRTKATSRRPVSTNVVRILEYKYPQPAGIDVTIHCPTFQNFEEFYVSYDCEIGRQEVRFETVEAAVEKAAIEFHIGPDEWVIPPERADLNSPPLAGNSSPGG